MDQNSINSFINNALIANRNNKYTCEEKLVSSFAKAIKENNYLFNATEEIDIKNENGFKLDANIIDKILKKYENVEPLIKTTNEISITDNNLLNSKLYSKIGVILVVYDGNPYTTLEMILLGLLTHNTMIFAYDGLMLGTNGLLINIVQTILENMNLKKEMFQHYVTSEFDKLFKNFKSINKTIIIGNSEFNANQLKKCTTEATVSGYKNYDIYIDSINNIDFIRKIINQNQNVNIYINSDLNIEEENAILVQDIDEAITYINYNSSKYCSAIFTDNNENASRFINEINSKNIMVNSSPTLEQSLDIKQEDLLKIKTIVMPNIYNFDGQRIKNNKEDK